MSGQIKAALIFMAGGFIVYVLYELFRAVRLPKRLPVLTHIMDGAFAVFACLAFIALSHFLYEGRIKYFTVLSYIIGGVISRLTVRPPVRKFIFFLSRLYNSRAPSDTNDTIEEVIMARTQNTQTQTNTQNNKTQGTRTQKAKANRTTKG